MKKCPLCGANCFDDMDTCYCCMHSFALETAAVMQLSEEFLPSVVQEAFPEEPASEDAAATQLALAEPAFAESAAGAALAPQAEVLFGCDQCIRIEIPLRVLSRARLDIPA